MFNVRTLKYWVVFYGFGIGLGYWRCWVGQPTTRFGALAFLRQWAATFTQIFRLSASVSWTTPRSKAGVFVEATRNCPFSKPVYSVLELKTKPPALRGPPILTHTPSKRSWSPVPTSSRQKQQGLGEAWASSEVDIAPIRIQLKTAGNS